MPSLTVFETGKRALKCGAGLEDFLPLIKMGTLEPREDSFALVVGKAKGVGWVLSSVLLSFPV